MAHFHIPKPLHGWREFVGEVGIIVLGVLIALGFEQLVQLLHDRRTASDARENIRAELTENLGRMNERLATQPCVIKRLDEIAMRLTESGSNDPPLKWIGRPQTWVMLETRWNTAESAGRTSLLTGDEQSAYDIVYTNMRDFMNTEAIEQAAWAQLRGLADLREITPQYQVALRQALQSARYAAWLANVDITSSKQAAAKLGLHGSTKVHGSQSVCVPSSTPFDLAVQLSGRPDIGEPR